MCKKDNMMHVNEDFAKTMMNFVMVDRESIDILIKKPIESDENLFIMSDFMPVHDEHMIKYSATVGGIKWQVEHDLETNDYVYLMQFPKCPIDITMDGELMEAYTGLYVEVPVIPQVFANAIAKEIINREVQTKTWIEKGLLVDEDK